MSLSRLFSLPAALSAGRREMALGTLGVAVGLGCTEWIGYLALGGQVPWFIIPMGASAVLLFCVPASPLAQPWPSLAGNLVSALIGVGCYRWLGETGAAVALAGCLAVGAMFVLRCLHPPGGAVALTAVLGGPLVHELGYGFALMPVLANTLAMLVVAFLFNNLVGRRYPHLAPTRVQPHDTADPLPSKRVGFRAEDLDAALAGRLGASGQVAWDGPAQAAAQRPQVSRCPRLAPSSATLDVTGRSANLFACSATKRRPACRPVCAPCARPCRASPAAERSW